MDKVLSVSIAAYNVEEYIKQALDSFLYIDNFNKLDIMIIDDGGTDKTVAIASEYQKLYPDVFRIIHKENGGWGSTLNSGIENAKGKYFKQLDGDDFYSENIDDFVNFLEKSYADMVYSPFVIFDNNTGGIIRVAGEYRYFSGMDDPYILNELDFFMPAMHSMTVKTELLKEKKVKITEHCFYTDVEFVIKAYSCCNTMQYYDLPVYYYRIARDGQSMSLSGVEKHYKEHQTVLFTLIDFYQKLNLSDGMMTAIRNRIKGVSDMQYSFYCVLSKSRKHKNEFCEFDNKLKPYSEFYNNNRGKLLNIMRQHNFFGYTVLAYLKSKRDKKYKVGFYA